MLMEKAFSQNLMTPQSQFMVNPSLNNVFSQNPLSRLGLNPVVALNSVFAIIEPLPIERRTLTGCQLLDHSRGDF
jgi:hypothetical protein